MHKKTGKLIRNVSMLKIMDETLADAEIARRCGISRQRLWYYRSQHPDEFDRARNEYLDQSIEGLRQLLVNLQLPEYQEACIQKYQSVDGYSAAEAAELVLYEEAWASRQLANALNLRYDVDERFKQREFQRLDAMMENN